MKDLERVEFHLRALVGGIWRLTRIHDLLVIQRDASRIQQFLQKTSKNHCGLVFCCLKKRNTLILSLCVMKMTIFFQMWDPLFVFWGDEWMNKMKGPVLRSLVQVISSHPICSSHVTCESAIQCVSCFNGASFCASWFWGKLSARHSKRIGKTSWFVSARRWSQ